MRFSVGRYLFFVPSDVPDCTVVSIRNEINFQFSCAEFSIAYFVTVIFQFATFP